MTVNTIAEVGGINVSNRTAGDALAWTSAYMRERLTNRLKAVPSVIARDNAAGADRRYSKVAIWLHWVIAALIVAQVALGWIMNEVVPDHTPNQERIEGIHISLGLTILLLVLGRIAVRLTHRPPPLPAGMPIWERALSSLVHMLLYALMLVMPLTGWALVSLGDHPISFWGLPWPHLPGVHALMGNPTPKASRQALKHFHVYIMIWIVLGSLLLHVAGAIKHQFDGRPVLWRMSRLKPPQSTLR